jgi:hypothetical protein
VPTFKVKDLMINVLDERLQLPRGSHRCVEDAPTHLVCTPASPIMAVARQSDRLEALGKVAARSRPEDLPELKLAAGKIVDVVLVAALQAGGDALRPDPECGNSVETFPPTITPVILESDFIRSSDLPAIKQRLRSTLAAVETLEAQLAPREDLERKVIAEHLEAAAASLRTK